MKVKNNSYAIRSAIAVFLIVFAGMASALAQSQAPQYTEPENSCISVSSSRNNWTTFQNNCSHTLIVVAIFANAKGSAIDQPIQPGAEHSVDAYGSGPFKWGACPTGYAPVGAGKYSLHYSDSIVNCLRVGDGNL